MKRKIDFATPLRKTCSAHAVYDNSAVHNIGIIIIIIIYNAIIITTILRNGSR